MPSSDRRTIGTRDLRGFWTNFREKQRGHSTFSADLRTIGVELIWDGSSQGTTNYSTTGLAKGDSFTVAARPTSAASTGRHTWELHVKVSGLPDLVTSGTTFVVDQSASPFGAGWNLSILNQDGRDANGNVTSQKDGLTKETDFVYDPLNEKTKTTDPNGNATQAVIDPDGEQTGSIDGAGDVTEQLFDPRGELVQTVDANGGKTLRTYDAGGNLLSLTDPDGNTTSWAYDADNNKIKETDALGGTSRSLFPLPCRTCTSMRALSMSATCKLSTSIKRKPQAYAV